MFAGDKHSSLLIDFTEFVILLKIFSFFIILKGENFFFEFLYSKLSRLGCFIQIFLLKRSSLLPQSSPRLAKFHAFLPRLTQLAMLKM